MLAQEYWLHTFHVPLPIRFSIKKVLFCQIENTQQVTSCLLLNNLANFIHGLHEETLGKLNETLQTIRNLIPQTKLSEITVNLVLYYLLLDLYPKEFLEQQPWMMFIYLLAILMHWIERRKILLKLYNHMGPICLPLCPSLISATRNQIQFRLYTSFNPRKFFH